MICPEATATLFAMAIELCKRAVFSSSMETVPGSPPLPVQVIVVVPPDVTLSGVLKVTAETKGRKRMRLQ